MKRALQVSATLFIVIGVYFAFSPYLALRGLRSALHSGDSVALEDRVDFPRLRENLKAQLNVAMLKNLNSELSENPFGALAVGLASKLVEGMVDSFVTPAGIASLARGERPNTGSIAPTSSSSTKEPFANARVTREALDRFSVWVPNDKGEEARFVFHRYGIRWKLTGIVIPLTDVSRSDRLPIPNTPSRTREAVLAVPPLRGRINDYAGLIPADRAQALEERLARFEAETGHQIAVLTISSLKGDSLENFSIRVAESWKIGKKGFDNGAILLIARDDRRLRLEVGYGLEGVMPDALASQIIREVITPRFRSGDYVGGIEGGVDAIMKVARGEVKVRAKK
jgi:hypothetical protein